MYCIVSLAGLDLDQIYVENCRIMHVSELQSSVSAENHARLDVLLFIMFLPQARQMIELSLQELAHII